MCSTLIPYFAEPVDIRLNITDPEPALSMSSSYHQSSLSSYFVASSSSSLLPNQPALNHYSESSASLTRSLKSAPHVVHRRNSNINENSSNVEIESDSLYSEEQLQNKSTSQFNTKHHSTMMTGATSEHRHEMTTHHKPIGSKHSMYGRRGDGYRREGNDHYTPASGTNNQTTHRHDPTRSQPDNQSLVAAARITHGGHWTPSPSKVTPNYSKDPVVARLLRR